MRHCDYCDGTKEVEWVWTEQPRFSGPPERCSEGDGEYLCIECRNKRDDLRLEKKLNESVDGWT